MAARGGPVEERVFGTEAAAIRPSFVSFVDCKNVLLEGFTIGGGPNWTVHPVYCENVIIRRLSVVTDGPNNDGIDPDSCRNVLIEHCTFDTGDDCVVLKSGYNEDGWRVGRPTENVVMRWCTSKRGHGGLGGGDHRPLDDRCRPGGLPPAQHRQRVDDPVGVVLGVAAPVGGDVAGVADRDAEHVGRLAELVADLEGAGLLALDPVGVDRVDERHPPTRPALIDQPTDDLQRFVERAIDGHHPGARDLRREAESKPVDVLVKEVIDRTQYYRELTRQYPDPQERESRVAALEEIVNAAASFYLDGRTLALNADTGSWFVNGGAYVPDGTYYSVVTATTDAGSYSQTLPVEVGAPPAL